ncbi:DUF6544 family protein, partial [Senegalia sp. (in: firmicutes)]|uniref:DUF6544 family protein n=1 Tax=Senegalia sp. (in: firmicutes) TaxID=1924098 RepID=UPI003F9D353C
MVSQKDLENLPKNVQEWLKYSGVIGKEKIISVRLKQKAEMRLEKDKSWMKVWIVNLFQHTFFSDINIL